MVNSVYCTNKVFISSSYFHESCVIVKDKLCEVHIDSLSAVIKP